MRTLGLVILLSVRSLAFGQGNSPAPFNPDNLGNSPSPWTSPRQEFKLPPNWDPLRVPAPETVLLSPPRSISRLGDVSIDPKIVVHPSPQNLGVQPPSTLVAKNLYPGLKFQLIEGQPDTPSTKPLPTRWPRLKLEPIPTEWPSLKMTPVGDLSNAVAFGPQTKEPPSR